jgi:diacylglycerol kinase family enzyme
MALAAVGRKRSRRLLPSGFARRGKVTGLVAVGGDGAFNLVARAGLKADIPVGVVPCGRFNNIARSLCGDCDPSNVLGRIVAQTYTAIDVGMIGHQPFVGCLAIGLIPHLARLLNTAGRPRWAGGWSRLAREAVSEVRVKNTVIKIDAFRFEISPRMINFSLLPNAVGLPLTPPAIVDDGLAEIAFDVGGADTDFGSFVKLISKNKYYYRQEVRLYRGTSMHLQPARGRLAYLDGELLEVPDNVLLVQVKKKALKVYR